MVVLSSFASADDYHWECLGNGDSLIRYTCHADCCILCAKYGYSRLFSYCYDKPSCSCGGSSGQVDQTPPQITIVSPEDTLQTQGAVTYYSSRAVLFDITVNEPVSIYYKDSADIRRGYRRICSGVGCEHYNRRLSFKDGCHTLTFKAVDRNLNEGYDQVTICIDSLEPRISKTYPKRNQYASRTFTTEYTEENVQAVTLYYKGENTDWFNVPLSDCPSGRKVSCSIEISGLPEGSLTYYFSVTDPASTTDSRQTVVNVDSTSPNLIINKPAHDVTYPSRGVPFDTLITETKTVSPIELSYTDLEDSRARPRRLCRSCTEYNRDVSFKDGFHKVLIEAKDEAGNEDTEIVEFHVDSKEPRIKRTYPRRNDYANGLFTVEYDESQVDSVTLHYKGSGDWTHVDVPGCESGRRQSCSVQVNNLPEGILTYYFTVADKATAVDSKETQVYVDTTSPTVIVNKPDQTIVPTYSERRVPFDILIAEPQTTAPIELNYIDLEDPRGRSRRLCRGCTEYNRDISFRDGFHRVQITAEDEAGNSDEEIVEFYVDSRDPRISRTYPRRGHGNGNFTVQYQEDALVEVILYYEQYGNEGQASTTNCPSGRREQCRIYVPGLNNGLLTYYFSLEDKAGTIVLSREEEIMIDTTKPEFDLNSPKEGEAYDRYAPFDITGLDEKVTLEYLDHEETRQRFRRLCSNCESYVRNKPFRRGPHDVVIRATDLAGNRYQQQVQFDII